MSRPSTLYYDGYDPSWIIGTGKPPPVHPAVLARPPMMVGPGPNRPVAGVVPFAPVPANVPVAHLHHGQPGPVPVGASGKHRPPPAEMYPHENHLHGNHIGRSNLGPTVVLSPRGKGKVKSAPGVVGMNPGPYLHAPVAALIHEPLPPAVHVAQGPVAVPVVRTSVPVAVAPVPVVHGKGPVPAPVPVAAAPPGVKLPGTAQVAVATPGGLREVPVNPLVKVVMFVPLHCDGCERKWKDKLTDLPGFQGYDVERRLDRVIVFGHVSPSLVLSTIQECVPRAQMWRL